MLDIAPIADEAFAVLNTGRQVAPFSQRFPGFDLDAAYRVTASVREKREATGERPIGRKIGFTNRTIWAEYDVYAPMWGYVYDQTVRRLADVTAGFPLAGLAEPRLEPEIMFRFARAPSPGMDERALLSSIEWVSHGFEIVQSIFPAWKFTAADTVAAYGLHGALFIGETRPVAGREDYWLEKLSTFEIDLFRDGVLMDHGRAANVLDGPLTALRYLVDMLARDPVNPPFAAGEIVTTGTLTKALPITPGAMWSTRLSGIDLPGITLRFV
jgi:2-oxo-3-hexenedioate decarboxylase